MFISLTEKEPAAEVANCLRLYGYVAVVIQKACSKGCYVDWLGGDGATLSGSEDIFPRTSSAFALYGPLLGKFVPGIRISYTECNTFSLSDFEHGSV